MTAHAGVVPRLREEARRLGFADLGVTTPEATAHLDHYRDWVAAGHHGEMAYLARPESVARRGDLGTTLEGVRSVVVVAHEYAQPDPPGVPEDPSRAVIARYARGDDYHHVVTENLVALAGWLAGELGGLDARAYVDTGPILERDLARRAGLGWFGRNTMLINPDRGSYFFLGLLLVDAELPPDEPFEADRCGTCTACLDACPTGALLGRDETGAPVMDARRCISYLTIELKGAIPEDLRPLMGNRVFGCDICQEVCPWNERFATRAVARVPLAEESAYGAREGLDGPSLVELADRLLALSGKGFTREFAGSPLVRAGRKGLLRNVCVALGNWGAEGAVPVLTRALEDPSDLVREHAKWALEQLGPGSSRSAPQTRSG
jgi:epoxyqueuosine reductase